MWRGPSLASKGIKTLKVIKTKDLTVTILDKPIYQSFPQNKAVYIIVENKLDMKIGANKGMYICACHFTNYSTLEIDIDTRLHSTKDMDMFLEKYKDIVTQIKSVERQVDTFLKNNRISRQNIFYYKVTPTSC